MQQKKWKSRRQSFFIRLLLSNIAIAAVCAMAMFSLSAFQSLRVEKRQYHADFEASTSTFSQDFSLVVDSLQNVANNLTFYQDIQPFSYKEHISEALGLIRTIKGLQYSNPYISELYVCFYNDNHGYSSTNTMSMDDLSEKLSVDLSRDGELRKQLSEYMRPIYKSAGDRVLVFYPFLRNYENHGMIILTLSQQMLDRLLQNDSSSSSNPTTLLYSDNQLLSPSVFPEELLPFEDVINEHLATEKSLTYEDTKIYLKGSSLSPTLYYVRFSFDKSVLFTLLQNPWVYFLVALLCACSVLIFTLIIARKNYRPIQTLGNSLLSSAKESSETDHDVFPEFQQFLSTYTGLQKKNRELEQNLQHKFELEQKHILQSILNGSTGQYEDFLNQALDFNIDLSAPYHLLISTKGPDLAVTESLRPLFDTPDQYAYPLSGTQDETLYIIGCEEPPSLKSLANVNASNYVWVSAPVSDPLMLHQQYLRMQVARSLSQQDGLQNLAEELIERYTGEITRLSEALSNEDAEELDSAASQLEEAFRNNQFSEATMRYLCFHIFYLYKNYQEEHLSGGKGHITSPESLLQNDTSTLPTALKKETGCVLKLIAAQNDSSSKAGISIEKVLGYIQEHYMEPDFSLQMISNVFEVSPSYFSTFFKENHGIKMLDYCTLLRMEKARQLLLTTDLLLPEIARQTGYYNTSSFIRRFKQVCGVTPREFKKNPTALPPTITE